MGKIEVANKVAKELWETERALDAAITQTGGFVTSMIEARQELNLSAVVGADVQTKVMEAMSALAQARSAVVAAHGDLAVLQRAMGIPTEAVGDGLPGTKPEVATQGSARRLRVAS